MAATHPRDDALARARNLLADAGRIVALTGAGISTESGIPDFRGPDGLWTRDPAAQRLSSLADYREDPQVRREAWRRRVRHPAWTALPNAGHRALARLGDAGRLAGLLTQNIDELHQRAGSDPRLVVELHGSLYRTMCLDCAAEGPMAEALARVRAGAEDPPCVRCGGVLKSATISFGQPLDSTVLGRARQLATDCDLLLVVGTSLTVQPAAGLVGVAVRSGAAVVIVNADPTRYDRLAAVVVRGRVGAVLPRLLGLPG